MKINLLLLTVITITTPLIGMENSTRKAELKKQVADHSADKASLILLEPSIFVENETPGQAAIKNNPKSWLASKITAGTTGSIFGFLGYACLRKEAYDLIGRSVPAARTRLQLLKVLLPTIPFIYGGWKGGQAVAEAAWNGTWKVTDRIKKVSNYLNDKY